MDVSILLSDSVNAVAKSIDQWVDGGGDLADLVDVLAWLGIPRKHLVVSPGGGGANVARVTQEWACHTHLFGLVGEDPEGEMICSADRDRGLAVHLLKGEPGQRTPILVMLIRGGKIVWQRTVVPGGGKPVPHPSKRRCAFGLRLLAASKRIRHVALFSQPPTNGSSSSRDPSGGHAGLSEPAGPSLADRRCADTHESLEAVDLVVLPSEGQSTDVARLLTRLVPDQSLVARMHDPVRPCIGPDRSCRSR